MKKLTFGETTYRFQFVSAINEFSEELNKDIQTTEYSLYKNEDWTGYYIKITNWGPNGNSMGKKLFIRFFSEESEKQIGVWHYDSFSTEKDEIDLELFIQILNKTILHK